MFHTICLGPPLKGDTYLAFPMMGKLWKHVARKGMLYLATGYLANFDRGKAAAINDWRSGHSLLNVAPKCLRVSIHLGFETT